jgi:hypothetical protein
MSFINLLQEGNTQLLLDIGCVDPLKKLASGPNGIAAKYAGQTLRLIGQEVPHKLSQQVPTWYVLITCFQKFCNQIKKQFMKFPINVLGSSSTWTCRISNICYCLPQAGAVEKIKKIFKIRHVQINKLPRTKDNNYIAILSIFDS